MPKLTASSVGLAAMTTMTTTMFGTSFVCLAFMFSNSASFGSTTSSLFITTSTTCTSHIIHKGEKELSPLFFTRAFTVLFFTRAPSSCSGLLRYLCNQLAGFQCFIYILLYYFFELWVVLAYNDLFKLCF